MKKKLTMSSKKKDETSQLDCRFHTDRCASSLTAASGIAQQVHVCTFRDIFGANAR